MAFKLIFNRNIKYNTIFDEKYLKNLQTNKQANKTKRKDKPLLIFLMKNCQKQEISMLFCITNQGKDQNKNDYISKESYS